MREDKHRRRPASPPSSFEAASPNVSTRHKIGSGGPQDEGGLISARRRLAYSTPGPGTIFSRQAVSGRNHFFAAAITSAGVMLA